MLRTEAKVTVVRVFRSCSPKLKHKCNGMLNPMDERIANATFMLELADLMGIRPPFLHASKVAHAMH